MRCVAGWALQQCDFIELLEQFRRLAYHDGDVVIDVGHNVGDHRRGDDDEAAVESERVHGAAARGDAADVRRIELLSASLGDFPSGRCGRGGGEAHARSGSGSRRWQGGGRERRVGSGCSTPSHRSHKIVWGSWGGALSTTRGAAAHSPWRRGAVPMAARGGAHGGEGRCMRTVHAHGACAPQVATHDRMAAPSTDQRTAIKPSLHTHR